MQGESEEEVVVRLEEDVEEVGNHPIRNKLSATTAIRWGIINLNVLLERRRKIMQNTMRMKRYCL